MIGVALSFLMSFSESADVALDSAVLRDLLQRFVVDKARGILGKVELPLLDVLAEFPVASRQYGSVTNASLVV